VNIRGGCLEWLARVSIDLETSFWIILQLIGLDWKQTISFGA
jgi:hypothetical protein